MIRVLKVVAVLALLCLFSAQIPVIEEPTIESAGGSVVMNTAIASAIDGPNKNKVDARAPDYVGIDRLSVWDGDYAPKVERWHDRQSGVEFICVRDRGCVLTGRSWK